MVSRLPLPAPELSGRERVTMVPWRAGARLPTAAHQQRAPPAPGAGWLGCRLGHWVSGGAGSLHRGSAGDSGHRREGQEGSAGSTRPDQEPSAALGGRQTTQGEPKKSPWVPPIVPTPYLVLRPGSGGGKYCKSGLKNPGRNKHSQKFFVLIKECELPS